MERFKLAEKKENNVVKKSTKDNIIEWIICFIIAFMLALIFRYYIGTPTLVKQASMYPTVKEGQRLIINRTHRLVKQTFNRGDIITFEKPIINLSNATKIETPIAKFENVEGNFSKFLYYVMEFKKDSLIKRVIGIEGDTILIKDNQVYVNGVLHIDAYNGITPTLGQFYDITVPKGCLFVMGDNRPVSLDSRVFGCIPINKVEGKILLRFYPLNKIGKIK